ncbi:MAG TPA: hypothetical protein VJ201_02795 [Candidatus Babeliales bacterium]|nr:hypothetical protein [Candidatus Babeliales bacterium]
MSRLIRVSEEAYLRLNQIAKRTGFSKQLIIDEAIERLERENILRQANEVYANQKNDPEKLREFEEEMAIWDVTLSEGLDDE